LVFADVEIKTDFQNAIQTIKTIIISKNSTDTESERLFDINRNNDTKIRLYKSNLSRGKIQVT